MLLDTVTLTHTNIQPTITHPPTTTHHYSSHSHTWSHAEHSIIGHTISWICRSFHGPPHGNMYHTPFANRRIDRRLSHIQYMDNIIQYSIDRSIYASIYGDTRTHGHIIDNYSCTHRHHHYSSHSHTWAHAEHSMIRHTIAWICRSLHDSPHGSMATAI